MLIIYNDMFLSGRLGRSPLLEAVQSKKMENVLLLFRHGAHLTMDSMELGVELNKSVLLN